MQEDSGGGGEGENQHRHVEAKNLAIKNNGAMKKSKRKEIKMYLEMNDNNSITS